MLPITQQLVCPGGKRRDAFMFRCNGGGPGTERGRICIEVGRVGASWCSFGGL